MKEGIIKNIVDRSHSKSSLSTSKIIMIVSRFFTLLIAIVILLDITSIKIYYPTRSYIMIFALIFDFLRLCLRNFYLLQRNIPFKEAVPLLILFIIMDLLFTFAAAGSFWPHIDGYFSIWIGLAITLFGGYLNSYSEYARTIWKKNPENKGKLYTIGLFKYSMHINYFGDALCYLGIAMISVNPFMYIWPAMMFLNFIFGDQIKELDDYLRDRYKE